jgi:hypothetical protein
MELFIHYHQNKYISIIDSKLKAQIKKKITPTSLFWLAYGTLLLILIFNIGVPKNPPSDPRGWGNDEVKSIIYLMYFDCVVLMLFLQSLALYVVTELDKNLADN